MRCFILFLIFLSACQYQVNAEVFSYTTPYYNTQYNRPNYYTPHRHSRFSDINEVENYVFRRNYPRDNELQRLQRLEMQAFGAIQSGDPDTRYLNAKNALLARPNYNYKTSFMKNLTNYFAGQMTGYTPGIYNDPYFSNNYPTNYGSSSAYQYSSPFGNGYRINNAATGNYSTVRILD